MPAGTGRLALAFVALAGLRMVLPDDLGVAWWWGSVLLVAVAALDLALALGPGRLEVGRDLPSQVALGATSRSALVVRNPTARRARLAVADELSPSLRADTRRWRVVVPGRSEARIDTRIRPGRRGAFQPAKVTLRSIGPLGLAAQSMRRKSSSGE